MLFVVSVDNVSSLELYMRMLILCKHQWAGDILGEQAPALRSSPPEWSVPLGRQKPEPCTGRKWQPRLLLLLRAPAGQPPEPRAPPGDRWRLLLGGPAPQQLPLLRLRHPIVWHLPSLLSPEVYGRPGVLAPERLGAAGRRRHCCYPGVLPPGCRSLRCAATWSLFPPRRAGGHLEGAERVELGARRLLTGRQVATICDALWGAPCQGLQLPTPRVKGGPARWHGNGRVSASKGLASAASCLLPPSEHAVGVV